MQTVFGGSSIFQSGFQCPNEWLRYILNEILKDLNGLGGVDMGGFHEIPWFVGPYWYGGEGGFSASRS